jgi:hypothetical protein
MEELTLEQELELVVFDKKVDMMSADQARDLLKKVHRTMMIREAMYKAILKKRLGVEDYQQNINRQL